MGLLLLCLSTPRQAWQAWAPLLFFVPLALAADYFTFQMPGGIYLSLETTACLFCALLLGPVMATWTAGLSIALNELLLLRRGPHFAARSTGMYILMWLAGGLAYQAAGGGFPLTQLRLADLLRALLLFLVTALVNRGVMALDRLVRGLSLRHYLTYTAPRTLLIEGGFASTGVVMAAVYPTLGWVAVALLILILLLALATARQLKRASDSLQRQVTMLGALNHVGRLMGSCLEPGSLLELIREGAGYLVDTSNFWVAVHDPERNEVVYEVLYDDGRSYPPERAPYDPQRRLAAYITEHRMPVLVHTLEDLQRLPIRLETVGTGRLPESVLGVPMLAKGRALGAIATQSYRPHAFTQDDLETLMTLASQAAVALENAHLFREVDESQRYLRAVLDSVDYGLVVTDLRGRVRLANRAMTTLCGVSEEQASGRLLAEVVGHRALVGIAERIAQGEVVSRETLQVELGDSRVLAASVAPVTDVQGERLGYVVAMVDVTPLHHLSQMKSHLIHIVSHDLRNPLHLAGGFFRVLLDELPPLTNQQSELAQRVSNHLKAMERLIDDLLQLERVEQMESSHPERVDPGQLVREVLSEQCLYAELKGQRLWSDIPEGLPAVKGDRRLLAQVVANLVDNAVKYTPQGGEIGVRVWAEPGEVLITVQDTGVGIPLEAQPRVFDQFFRARQPGTESVSGSGLGLSLVRAIVQQYGGRVWVESEGVPGRGSTFGVALPVAP